MYFFNIYTVTVFIFILYSPTRVESHHPNEGLVEEYYAWKNHNRNKDNFCTARKKHIGRSEFYFHLLMQRKNPTSTLIN